MNGGGQEFSYLNLKCPTSAQCGFTKYIPNEAGLDIKLFKREL